MNKTKHKTNKTVKISTPINSGWYMSFNPTKAIKRVSERVTVSEIHV